MNTRSKRAAHALLLALLTGGLIGCGVAPKQRAAVESFSAAADRTAGLASAEFAQVRQDVIALRQGMLALGAEAVDLEDPALDLDGPLDLEDAEARLEAAEALGRFADLLKALVGPADGGRVRRAGRRFAEGLANIEDLEFPEQRTRALGQLFTASGRSLTGSIRRRALRRAVAITHGPLQRLAEDLRRGFTPDAGLWAAGLRETIRQIETLGKQMQLDDRGERSEAQRAQYQKLRAEAARRMRAFEQARAQVLAALDAFEEAHDALLYAVQSEDIGAEQIERFYQKTQRLVRLYQLIRG